MGANLKNRETVTLRVFGDGPISGMIVDATASGTVRGYARNPQVDLSPNSQKKLDVGTAVGRQGFIHVTYALELRDPYTGSAPLSSGEIAQDLAHYFRVSEQIPSVVSLGVLVGKEGVLAAGGFMIQLPNTSASEDLVSTLERNVSGLGESSRLIHEGVSPEGILDKALEGLDFHPEERKSIVFACTCNEEKVKGALAALGRRELIEILEKEGQAQAKCEFCAQEYVISRGTLEELLQWSEMS